MDERQGQMFSCGFAEQQRLFPDRRFTSPALALLFQEMRTAQMKRMFAVLTAYGINPLVQISYFFRFYGVFKEGILPFDVSIQIKQDNSCRPVYFLRTVQNSEHFPDDSR